MGPGEDADLAGDRPNLFKAAAIEAPALADDAVAHHLFFVAAEQIGDLLAQRIASGIAQQ